MELKNYFKSIISINFNPKIPLPILIFINKEDLKKYNNSIRSSKTSYNLKKIASYYLMLIMTILYKKKVNFILNFIEYYCASCDATFKR